MRVGIDVKNKAKRLDIVAMEQLAAMGEKLALDRYGVYSTSGFTEEAEAKRHGVELFSMEEFEQSEFWAYPAEARVRTTQLELLHVWLVYPDGFEPELRRPIKSVRPKEVVVSGKLGRATLDEYVQSQGIRGHQQLQTRLNDGEHFELRIKMGDEAQFFRTGHPDRENPGRA
jgi:hypothetical protein